MAAIPTGNTPGNGVGISGPAYAEAQPRQAPAVTQGTQDGPKPQQLHAAWEAYNGRFGDGDGPLKNRSGVPNVNVNSNRIRPITETGVDYLFGPALTISTENAQAQKILDAAFGNIDKQMTLLSKSGINGAVYGHVFVKVIPPRRGKPSVVNPPRLVLLNPEAMSIETDPDDVDLVVRFCNEYATTDERGNTIRKRQTVTRIDPDNAGEDDRDTTWEIQDWVATTQFGNTWQPVGAPVEWPYALPPVIDWQNYPNPNSHWGQPDVTESLINLNKQLRLCESNTQLIGFVQGSKIMYSTGADTSSIKPTPGEIIDLGGSGGADKPTLEAVDSSGNLQELMAFANQIRSDMDEESGIPGVALGRMQEMPRAQISGVAMELLHASALARTEHKRRLYGQGITQVCQTALILCGMALDEALNTEIKLTWQSPLPNDDFAEAQAWQIKVSALGYSQTTAIEETGGDPDVEQERKQEEQTQQVNDFAQGKGMPPALSPQMMQEPSPDGQATSQPSQAQPQGNLAALNNPKAQAARATMKQMAGS